MVKKKRQNDPGENGDDSTESCDETVKPSCSHVGKAVDLTRLKKSLKLGGFDKECAECKKTAKTEVSDPDFEEDLSLWMCLRCGSQLCGRARNKHALNHFQTPHSDCHALTTNTTTWEVYCYSCNNEVTASSSKKLHECVEYLKKQAVSGITNKSLPPIELPPPIELIIKTDAPLTKGKDKAMALNPKRVRGLSNLGNTCFFNSVMQCLAQTPYLLQVLQEMATPGEKFTLPGGKLKLKVDGDDEGKEVDLPPITGELAEWGTLTKTLAETLADLQSGEGGVYTPRKLLSALVHKLPQFGGGDQHDAHELLRHLLEAVRSEDLRRYRSVILTSLGMNSKVDPSKVDDEVKQKVKFYGQQASDTMLRPEQVFRGFLVSTLECQECFHQSEREEHFLDLSLPVAASRPQPPAVVRRKTPNEENIYNTQEENKPSKHQLKKERIAAKKAARKNKGTTSGANKEEGAVGGASSSSESDADVEDNADEPAGAAPVHTAANFAAYLESGYNSEKVVSSDSFRTSPVDKDSSPDLPDGPGPANSPELPDEPDITNGPVLLNGPELLTGAELPSGADLAGGVDALPGAGSTPDSGVASPAARAEPGSELGTEPSTEMNTEPGPPPASPAADLPPRPVSRIAFFPESGNEVVSRGISVRGSRSLLEHGEPLDASERLDRLRLDEDECSVRSCLAQFTALELLTGNNKVGCDPCSERINGRGGRPVYTNATKRFLVRSAPPVLILHLKRFQLGPRCMFRKMSRHVEFPSRLELGAYCWDARRRSYALYGVVEHSGGMHGGHYVAYVRARAAADDELSGYESGGDAAPARRWYYVSDSCVSEVSEDKVLRAQAYLLFYERAP